MKIAALTQIRNESKRLKEWIEFHSFFYNIDHFLFYLDNPEDDSEIVLKELQKKYNIEYKFAIQKGEYNGNNCMIAIDRQKTSFTEGFKLLKNNFDWIIVFDVDEWIVPSDLNNFNLKNYLLTVKNNILYLPMYNFVPPFDYNKSITEQKFYRWSCQERIDSGHLTCGKSIIKGKILLDRDFTVDIHLGPDDYEYRKNVDFESKNHKFKLHQFQGHLVHQSKKYDVYDNSIQKMFSKMKNKIAVVSGWYNFGGNKGISDDNRFMTDCFFKSAKKYFLPHHDVDFIFMNNSDITIDGVININFEYKVDGFWQMCLMKILSLRFLEKEYDYIFVNDNDQIFIKEVNDDILNYDFVFLNHFYQPTVESIHKEVTDIVDLNFNTKNEKWTMGNFFGGKKENMLELLKMTEHYHTMFFGRNYEDIHFYSRYPEELFILKYVYENNINHKRLTSNINPLEITNDTFLSDWGENDKIPNEIKNVTLLHNVKKDFNRLKKTFQTENKKNIVVAQFYTSNVSYGEYSEKINKTYCNHNGYEYFVEKDKDKIKNKIGSRSWTWYKPFLLQEVFSKYPECDYVLFMDIDAIFCNNNRKIEEFITNDFSILMTHDYGPSLVNAGVMLLKNDEFSKNFIQQWWDICEEYPQYKEGLWHDQTCIGLLHDRLNKPKEFKIIQNYDFNAREYNEDRFIFHAFSYGATPYRSIDKIYNKKFKPENTNKNYEKIKAIVYHIYCVGDYLNIVSSQIKRLIDSGLYDWCNTLEVTCCDPKNNFLGIDNIFNSLPKTKLFKTKENKYEYWSIKKVWDLSQQYNGQVFYFHAKGVSNTYVNLRTNEICDWKINSISFWREMLEYFLIENFKDCLGKLETKDTCGVTCNNGWYWGNFWWANLSYVRENVKPEQMGRWYYEDWLHKNRDYNFYEFFKFNFNPYFTLLPIEVYRNLEKIKSIDIESAFYGTIGIQTDEGYPTDIPVIQNDVTNIVKQHFKNRELSILVDNSVFGDPIYGHRKFLIINIEIDDSPYKLVFNEGTLANFNFN